MNFILFIIMDSITFKCKSIVPLRYLLITHKFYVATFTVLCSTAKSLCQPLNLPPILYKPIHSLSWVMSCSVFTLIGIRIQG